MESADVDVAADGDPVLDQLGCDLLDLAVALEMLEYHGHTLAAVVIRKELLNTKQLIGKWKAVHTARLPL
jgi:hypothetical protein